MYLTTDIDNLLEDNKFRFMNESITYKAMQRRLNKLFKKQHNVEFKIEKYDDFENDAISFSGIYDMFEEKTYIILNVSDHTDNIKVHKWEYFKFLLSQCIQHEKIHECQWSFRSCDEPCEKQWRESDKRDINDERLYLSERDELEAYGHDIALEIKYFYPNSDPMHVLSNINNYKRITSWNYYKKTFKGVNWLSLKKILLKKAFYWIKD
tara:strand:+ start:107 stop:733 length:627 start_codon:yes stop_codon:yes gene_type:complete